jgi:CheY-like chemotaxis protein
MIKRILIIEDDEILLSLLQKKLSKEGYQISIANDGLEGVKKIREEKPDLILLDIIMPRVNGFEVLEEIQKDPALKTIPVIVISNSGEPTEINKIKRLGVKDWLIKTEFDPQEIINKIKNIKE